MKPFVYEAKIPTRVAGIPCLIGVLDYVHVKPWKGSPHTCWSDMDYYGYTEMDWELLDRKGYLAPWLDKKLTEDMRDDIEQQIHNYMQEQLEKDHE